MLSSSASTREQKDTNQPYSSSPLVASGQLDSDENIYMSGRPMHLAGIALWAFGLGTSLGSSLIALVLVRLWTPHSPHWRLAFYGLTLSAFHFLEFWTTARYNTRAASVKSFVPTGNLLVYLVAHTFAFLECLIYRLIYFTGRFKPFPGPPITVIVGLPLVIGGQLVRTLAIIHAGPSFRGSAQNRRKGSRVLVTTGIYSVLRHPSYFGFFWWAIGTQLVLGNTFSFLGFVFVLWSFFAGRVRREEESMNRAFGKTYEAYRKRVWTLMPFIG